MILFDLLGSLMKIKTTQNANEYLIMVIMIELNSSRVALYAKAHDYAIGTVFDPSDGVVNTAPIYRAYCLEHVVLHFDSAEIYFRKYLQKSKVTSLTTNKKLSNRVQKNYRTLY